MASDILVVTPSGELGDSIRGMLPPARFNLHVTGDFSHAIRLVRQTGCSLAVLDAALDVVDTSVQDVAYALKQLNGDIQLVVLVSHGMLPELGALVPRAVLIKPVSETELLDIVDQVFPPEAEMAESRELLADPSSEMPWLKDVRRAAQHLTRLTLESSAQAALIANNNTLWAYAGQLSQAAANELTQMVQRYWDWRSDSDLLRFVRLAATEQAHMLYATRLSSTMILALVFDGETPFSTIRSQAGRLATSLSTLPGPTDERSITGPHATGDSSADDLRNYPHINTLLNDVPPPIPEARLEDRSAPRKQPVTHTTTVNEEPIPVNLRPVRHSVESSPVRFLNEQPVKDKVTVVDPQALVETRRAVVPDDLAVTRKQVIPPAEPDPQSLAVTRPQELIPEADQEPANVQRMVLEPASSALYNLNYACLLIPRFENHHLVGDLADRLGEWIPQLCIAFAWRLEYLSIRPAYLQWVVNIPPAGSPGAVMKLVRQHTSERIFKEFPRFKTENPSGDFWAPGYLIMGGSQPHPPKFVKDFILQTRQRQGISGK